MMFGIRHILAFTAIIAVLCHVVISMDNYGPFYTRETVATDKGVVRVYVVWKPTRPFQHRYYQKVYPVYWQDREPVGIQGQMGLHNGTKYRQFPIDLHTTYKGSSNNRATIIMGTAR